jgi:NAD(P)-dependent dehydrogenase (short-subunit alcohol dehydrogenase family)
VVVLTGKVALITGAGRGMGEATAKLFARNGATVVVAELDADTGESVAAAIRADGGRAHFVRCDVGVEADLEAAVAYAVETFGSLDCAVNNAAIKPDHHPVVDVDADEFDRIISIDLRGVLLGMKYELRQMTKQGSGAVVNVASMNAFRAQPRSSAYTAAKHGVIGLTKTAAMESAAAGIRVNAVCPGAIYTPMMEEAIARRGIDPAEHAAKLNLFGRFGRPEEVAEGSLWLCSDAASFVTGHALNIDGGYLAS